MGKPLRPPTLAPFRAWGNSAGAGRIRLTRCKNTNVFILAKDLFLILQHKLTNK